MSKDIDELISKYTEDLLKLKEKWAESGIETQAPQNVTVESSPEAPKAVARSTDRFADEPEIYGSALYDDTAVKEDKEKENIYPTSELPLASPENFALLTAKVYSGSLAYAIPDAKISIYLDGKLHAFLITDENGTTKQIKLESYPKINSFIPESEEQTVDYSADIYAEGFAQKKALLVSAVGGSDILLTTELTPLSERID